MKTKLFFFATLFLITMACNDKKEKTQDSMAEPTEDNKPSIIGTWERTSFYNYVDNKITDSFASTAANRHIKMFSPGKVMWCRKVAADSTEWFGYGSYTVSDTLLTEVLEFGSRSMNFFIAKEPTFVFKLDLEDDKFSQIQIDDEGHPIFAENYIRIE